MQRRRWQRIYWEKDRWRDMLLAKDLASQDVISRAMSKEILEGKGTSEIKQYLDFWQLVKQLVHQFMMLIDYELILYQIQLFLEDRLLIQLCRSGNLDRNNRICLKMLKKLLLLELIDQDIMKDLKKLHKLKRIFEELCKSMEQYLELKKHYKKGLKNILVQCKMTIEEALHRKGSKGADARDNFPQRDDKNWMKHILARIKNYKSDNIELTYRDVINKTQDPKEFDTVLCKKRVY